MLLHEPSMERTLIKLDLRKKNQKNQHTRGENERYLNKSRKNRVQIFGKFAFDTATYERTNRCKTTDMSLTYLDVTGVESGLEHPFSQMWNMDINTLYTSDIEIS